MLDRQKGGTHDWAIYARLLKSSWLQTLIQFCTAWLPLVSSLLDDLAMLLFLLGLTIFACAASCCWEAHDAT